MKEAELAKYAKAALEKSGLVYWRVSNGPVLHNIGPRTIMKRSQIAGFPDWAGISPKGMFWAMELKTAKGKVEPHQQDWIDKINFSYGMAEVARSFEEIDNFIDRVMDT